MDKDIDDRTIYFLKMIVGDFKKAIKTRNRDWILHELGKLNNDIRVILK